MSKATLWRTVLALGLAAGTTLAFATGCSKQGEGERCSPSSNGNADCDDGLYCKPTGEADFGRCCPVDLATVGDARCSFTPNMAATGGTNGTGTGGGGASTGGTSTGGRASTGGTSTGGRASTGGTSTGGANASGGDAPSTGGGEEPGGGAAGSSASGGDTSAAAGAGAMSSE
jgi:hypothetical protein